MNMLKKPVLALLTVISFTVSASENPVQSIQEDLTASINWIKQTHPQLSYSADEKALQNTLNTLSSATFTDAPSAWRTLALLNPILNDGHLGVRFPKSAYKAYQQAGGLTLNLAVKVNEQDGLELSRPYRELPAGTVITQINGLASRTIVSDLMVRMRGESRALRQELIHRRFAAYFWSMYGGAAEYEVSFAPEGKAVTYLLAKNEKEQKTPAPENFDFRMMNSQTAYMSIRSFAKPLETEFATFLKQSFTEIKTRTPDNLVIDLRDNGGGAHDLSDQLLNYLTDKKVTPISKVTARVVPANQKLLQGAKLGSVVSTPYARWYQPELENPLRFAGNVYVLIGKFTYSQAIVFATQIQDFGLGTLVGEPTGGRGNQTAQVQHFTLPQSGLDVVAPLYIMVRASGKEAPHFVQPDIQVDKAGTLTAQQLVNAISM